MPGQETLSFALLVFTSLLAIVDPVAAVPIFLTVTGDYTDEHRRATLRAGVITGTFVLVLFTLLGSYILRFFGITTDAFRIAGGILFLGVGADMLQARRSRVKTSEGEEEEASHRAEVGVIPLGIPTLAGPGAITTVITLDAQAKNGWEEAAIYAAIVLVMTIAWVSLAIAPTILRRLGRTGLNVITRLMGLLVMVIGVQFMIDGITGALARVPRP
jgi:multiple antibiotic resistance protein